MRVVLALLLALWATSAEAATKCVNGSTGSDATTYAANDGVSSCWQTLGRAAWGSTTRSSPNTGEALQAGDTVNVAAGTYNFSGTVAHGDAFDVLYNPANSGSVGNPIRFSCIGSCAITAPDWEAPVIGATNRDYIQWYASRVAGYAWVIPACGENPAGGDDCGVGTAAGAPDTGPVVCHTSDWCHFEGLDITATAPITYVDNWPAFRFQEVNGGTVRNNSCSDFTDSGGGNHNQSCLMLYGTQNVTIEHNEFNTSNSGVFFKDTSTTANQGGNIIRFNRFTTVDEAMVWSQVTAGSTETGNDIYQNVITGCVQAFGMIDGAQGSQSDDIVNNTVYNCSESFAQLDNNSGTHLGIRYWNNIAHTTTRGIDANSTMSAASILNFEHNVYFNYVTTFYRGSDGNRTLASFKATYTDQEDGAPVGVDTDPGFANAAGGDFRLCTAAGVPHASCAGASGILTQGVDALDLDGDSSTSDNIPAGAYLTGLETIGIDSAGDAPAPGTGSATKLKLRVGE